MKNTYLFVYGSLCDKSLRQTLLGHDSPSQFAKLVGYRAFYLLNQPYPALRRVPSAVTPGRLISGLKPVDLRRLDVYEGDWYTRVKLPICINFSQQVSWVYVLRPRYQRCLGYKLYNFPSIAQ